MIKQQLNKFLDRELREIRENRRRIGTLFACVLFAIGIFVFANSGEKVDNNSNEAVPKVDTKKLNDKSNSDKKTESKLTAIKGLERAAANVELINPFKVDIQNPAPVVDNKPVEAAKVPSTPPIAPVITSTQSTQTENNDSKETTILILKGIAISGDKKMAIIQKSNGINNNSSKSKSPNDENDKLDKTDSPKVQSLILNVGDKIEDHLIIDIDKNSVTFDDGKKLYVQEAL